MKVTVITSIISLLFGLSLGLFIGFKSTPKLTIPPCPECPDLIHTCSPAIEVQSLDLDKIRKIKGN